MDYQYRDSYALPTTEEIVSENPPVVDVYEIAALNQPRFKERLTGRDAERIINGRRRDGDYLTGLDEQAA